MMDIDWSKQHCGIHRGTIGHVCEHMPDVFDMIANTFPVQEKLFQFTWDVKVHMLMPDQYPCIPNWHYDNVPRDQDGKQDWSLIKDLPMYLWVSGDPMTEFKEGEQPKPKEWFKFTQQDLHRGTKSDKHCWRGFIRAAHKDILPPNPKEKVLRRHSQVYLDANNFTW